MARLPKTSVRSLIAGAQRFADAQPALAGALGRMSTEPSLERMREGLFYLAATVVDRVREFETEGYRALADVVAPGLARPFPAATIVELSSTDGAMHKVTAGAEVQTRGALACRFRLISDVEVGPWRAVKARIERLVRAEDMLQFDLVSTGPLPLGAALGDPVRFYIDGPRESSLYLMAHLLSHVSRVELTGAGRASKLLGEIRGYGLSPEDALAPEPDAPATALPLFRDYFLLPEKFCFFEIGGLAKALLDTNTKQAILTVHFATPLPAAASVAPDGVRAHCVPAVNLFPASAEPCVIGPGHSSFPVRVAGLSHEDGGVYAVLGASASPRDGAGPPVRIPPLRRFGAARFSTAFPYAFSTKLGVSPARSEPDLIVCLTSPRGTAPLLVPHVLSLDLLATNRQYGHAVRPGELTTPGVGIPGGVSARNIAPSSPYVRPPVGPEFAIQSVLRGAVPRGDPMFTLQALLFSMVPRHGVDPAVVRASSGRIRGIEQLRIEVVTDALHARRGYLASFSIDETPFQGIGDVALFLRLLHAALDEQTSVNRYYRCDATCTKSGARLEWPPEPPAVGALTAAHETPP
jgi:type VI secretion system protein ImpG